MTLTSILARDLACHNALAAFRSSDTLNYLEECFIDTSSSIDITSDSNCVSLTPSFQLLTRMLKLVTSEYLKPRRKAADFANGGENKSMKRRKLESGFSEKDIGVVVDPTAAHPPIDTMKEGHVDALVDFLTKRESTTVENNDGPLRLFVVMRKTAVYSSDLYFVMNLIHALIKFISIYKEVYWKDALDELVSLSLQFLSETLPPLIGDAIRSELTDSTRQLLLQSFLKGCAILRTSLRMQATDTVDTSQLVINICDIMSSHSTLTEVTDGLLEMCTETPFYSNPPCSLIHISYTTVRLQWMSVALQCLQQCLLKSLRSDKDDEKGKDVLVAVTTCIPTSLSPLHVHDQERKREKEKERGKNEEKEDQRENKEEEDEEKETAASYHLGRAGHMTFLHGFMRMDDDLLEVLNTLLSIELVLSDKLSSRSSWAPHERAEPTNSFGRTYSACATILLKTIDIPTMFVWFVHYILHNDENILLDMLLSKETLDGCLSFLLRALKFFVKYKDEVVRLMMGGCSSVKSYQADMVRLQRERDRLDRSNDDGNSSDGNYGKVAVCVSQEHESDVKMGEGAMKGEEECVDPIPPHVWHAQEVELQQIKDLCQRPRASQGDNEDMQQEELEHPLEQICSFLRRAMSLLKTIGKEPSTSTTHSPGRGEYVFGPLIELMKEVYTLLTESSAQ